MHRMVTGLLLAAAALFGVAHAAFLPPWEGFDETAHWSYIQELADTGHPPHYGVDGLAKDIDAYPGPMTYSGAEPFEKTGRPTYRSYRVAGARPIAGGPTRYTGDASPNWQAQHPPLYYAMMVPIYRAAHGLGWVDHLLVLRLASFALAFAGFAIGVLATARWAERQTATGGGAGLWTGPIMAAWPFLFPQFFPQFARLGNDSLCLLEMGIIWALLLGLLAPLPHQQGKRTLLSAAALGAVLGLGLLTKAFFLPIGAGVGLLLLARVALSRKPADLGRALLAGAVALAIGGWWYVQKRLETGAFTGSDEFIRLNNGGALAQLIDGYSLPELLHGLGQIVGTFLWAGTWSLARLPELWLIPLAALLGLTLLDYLRTLRRPTLIALTPLALGAPMAAGLVYHVFVWMAGASAATPGWYFHILAAPLGLAVAIGWRRPRLLGLLTAATGAYTLVAWSFQLSMFSGCAAKLGADKHYTLIGSACFIQPRALVALGRPLLGVLSLALGIGLALAAATLAWRAFRPGTQECVELAS